MDSILIKALIKELRQKFVGKNVGNVAQEGSDKFWLGFGKESLVICPSPNNSYLYATSTPKIDTENSSFLASLLKQHIAKSQLLEIEQIGLERVVYLNFRESDKFGLDVNEYILIMELIGRQSNLILTDAEKNIIDCWRRFEKQDAPRTLAPKAMYRLPESMGKESITTLTEDKFFILTNQYYEQQVDNALFQIIRDISPGIIKELIFRADVDKKNRIKDLSEAELEAIFSQMQRLKNSLEKEDFQPTVVMRNEEALNVFPITPKRFEGYDTKEFDSANQAAQFYYKNIAHLQKIKSVRGILSKSLEHEAEKLQKKLEIQKEELDSAERWEDYKLYGELINANLHKIRKGAEEVELQNYYDPEMKTVKIPLDPTLTPQENAQYYFRKYKKSKSGKDVIAHQIEITQQDLETVSNCQKKLEAADNLERLLALKDKFREIGYLKTQKRTSKSSDEDGIHPRQFVTSEGWTVLVGRNNKENDILTLHVAKKNDIWFHVQGATGSHVILKREGKKKQVSKRSLYEAASLAAGYSSAKHSENVPVIYTEKRYVRKPKGAPPGAVTCRNEKTIFVKPIQKLSSFTKNLN